MVLKSKLNGKNKTTAINAWAVTVFRYGAGMLQWKKSELKDVDKRSRKTMKMYGVSHRKSDVDRLYIKRKEGGRGLMRVERCVREEENSLDFYVANFEENLAKGFATNTLTSGEFKK